MSGLSGLKKRLSNGVFALSVADFISVFDYVSELPYIEEAAIFGSTIHILCDQKLPLKSKLSVDLKSKGISKFHIEKISPTLEDVFVSEARKVGI